MKKTANTKIILLFVLCLGLMACNLTKLASQPQSRPTARVIVVTSTPETAAPVVQETASEPAESDQPVNTEAAAAPFVLDKKGLAINGTVITKDTTIQQIVTALGEDPSAITTNETGQLFYINNNEGISVFGDAKTKKVSEFDIYCSLNENVPELKVFSQSIQINGKEFRCSDSFSKIKQIIPGIKQNAQVGIQYDAEFGDATLSVMSFDDGKDAVDSLFITYP